MNKNNLDKQITKLLKKETNDVTKLEDATWDRIQQDLFSQEIKSNHKRKHRFIIATAMVVMIGLVWIGFTTPTGQALFQSLKDMFVEEKDVELNIEGQKEATHTELETNEELRYVIYIDTSRYKLVNGETTDKIVLAEELPDEYPEVSMEIIYKEETTMEDTMKIIKQQLDDLDMEITLEEKVDEPISSMKISAIGKGYTNEHGNTGPHWDTPVYEYYITDDDVGRLFIIKQMYFLEASEGHGVRFDSMLESFEVVK